MHALLILDMQDGLFHGPEPIWRREQLLATINRLLDKAHLAGAPVFLARHVGPAGSPIEPGSPLTRLVDGLRVQGDETVFEKTRPNAFAGTGLMAWLKAQELQGVVIAGLKTQYCVDSTCRAARDLGLDAVLIEDGHSCSDTPVLNAGHIVAHHNATLNGAFCRVMPADDWQFA